MSVLSSILPAAAIDKSSPSIGQLLNTGIVSIAVRALGPVSSFLLTLLLARNFGAQATGYFFIALTLITACAIIAKFGLETALQRFVGNARVRQDDPQVIALYHYALRMTSIIGLTLSLVCYVLSENIAVWLFGEVTGSYLIAHMSLIILPFSLLGIHAALLKSLARPVWGSFFEAAAWPLFTLIGFILLLFTNSLSMPAIVLLQLLTASISLFLSVIVLRRYLPATANAGSLNHRQLIDSCLPLTGIELINYALLWLPFLLLPVLASTSDAGLYNVSHRLAAQLGLIMLVFASITSHRFASHHELGEHGELSRLAAQSTRGMLLLGLPVAIVLLVFSQPILNLFGEEFIAAETTLQILLIGQLFNLATGPVGYLLAMTGHERLLHRILVATALFMIIMACLLIPLFGHIGAALSVTANIIFHNVLCNVYVYKKLKIPFFLVFIRIKENGDNIQ